jgi:hypothetical protein
MFAPYRPPHMSANNPIGRTTGVRFICCDGQGEFEMARSFRDHIFWTKRRVAFSRSIERRRDAESHVFVLLHGGRPVATGRAQPYPSEISLVAQLCTTNMRALQADSEVGRIASAGSPLYAPMLLTFGAVWLLESTRHRHYIAYCHPKLLSMYRRLGAWDTGERWTVPDRDAEHVIVSGRYEDCARLGLEMLGVDRAQAAAIVRFPDAGCALEIGVALAGLAGAALRPGLDGTRHQLRPGDQVPGGGKSRPDARRTARR